MEEALRQEFELFVKEVEPPLRRAHVATYGFDLGRDATAEALGWAWEHWDRARSLDNKVAYLYRVGQTKIRSRMTPILFQPNEAPDRWFEPQLGNALSSLTERQRVAVVLIHGYGWTYREVADLMGIRVSSVQSHLERGLQNLKNKLEVHSHD